MITIILLLCCFSYHISAEQWQHFNVAIRAEHEEEVADIWHMPEPEFQPVDLPVAIFSRFVAGMAGGCYGEYVASHYNISEDGVAMVAVASSFASMVTIGLLLQNQKVARAINTVYRLCARKSDHLADVFIGRV